jgi:hypothetical protein
VNIVDISQDPEQKRLTALMKNYEDISIASASEGGTDVASSSDATESQAIDATSD